MTTRTKCRLLRLLGLSLSVLPPAILTLSYFPLWQRLGAPYIISGGTLLLLILSALPMIRRIKEILRSPSAYVIWLIIFLLFFTLSRIANEMCVISLSGFIGNLVGSLLFGAAKRCEAKK